jgi:hypothetical protein
MKTPKYTLPTTDRTGLAALAHQLRHPATPEAAELAALRHQLLHARHQLAQARRQAEQAKADAITKAHREDRLQRHIIADVDNRAQWRAKMGLRGSHQVRVTVTSKTLQLQDL